MSDPGASDRPLDPRAEAAERALADLGFPGVRVRPEGADDDIAVLELPETRWAGLFADSRSEVVECVRTAGFRYVALDLAPAAPST